ncbi:MAG: radical SAM family heme chaperone HemW [Phycisphaerales bacterium]|nr:radical SAM family heme chaperone HemW [Phycisphaerales bacterium]
MVSSPSRRDAAASMCSRLTDDHDIASQTIVEAARSSLEQADAGCSNAFLSSLCDAIYVHVPFCRHRCHYCDFYTIAGRDEAREPFVSRLLQEATHHLPGLPMQSPCVFIGGGTPTWLPPRLLEQLLVGLEASMPATVGEWTIEANPETVDADIARVLIDSPVNRVSMGMQSAQPKLLQVLERQHDPASVPRAVEHLRRGEMAISLDLIFGIPGQTLAQVQADLEAALALGPDHLSVYGLVFEPGTPLRRKRDQGLVQQVDEGIEADMYTLVRQVLAAAGFEQYEISNWARPGQRCQHNEVYWTNGNWWPLGPGAAGHVRHLRWKNQARLGAWLESPDPAPIVDVERADLDGQLGEALMMGLRLLDGVGRGLVEAACQARGRGALRREALFRHLGDLQAGGALLEWIDDRLRLTDRGLLLADSVIIDLL